jgi:hypothetical protein
MDVMEKSLSTIFICMLAFKNDDSGHFIAQNLRLLLCWNKSSHGIEGHDVLNFDWSPNGFHLCQRDTLKI